MESEINNVIFRVILAKHESEVIHRTEKQNNYEMKLQKWLEKPVETKRTDAQKEHDLVV